MSGHQLEILLIEVVFVISRTCILINTHAVFPCFVGVHGVGFKPLRVNTQEIENKTMDANKAWENHGWARAHYAMWRG